MKKQIINKGLVEKRFRESLKTYDSEASIQRIIANKLFSMISSLEKDFSTIYEIGCGTGFLSSKIIESIEFDTLIINDIVEESFNYIDRKNRNITFISGDMDKLGIPKSDLIVSSSTLQWSSNLPNLLDKVYSSLNSGGYFIFSTFGKSNFKEVSLLTNSSLTYYNIENYKDLMSKFSYVTLDEEKLPLFFDKSVDILRHQKLTGVNAILSSDSSKLSLFKFLAQYEKRFRTEKGLPLTYHPIYIMGRK
ncbi:MAG: malonyl-[acyl-carrier protein] O-methyltransferase BioC [Candidatus Cloacimonadota bacterium]|nr:MAG: malonyl-[acyl-carrier protein] O-methyltransferase BioC [Candidatus Cloacimonadota bacterium]PIE78030.1 MAG: malonyl-[acyl-carrier protein] O-methyltransferase BioC [Candidatus Delongbacteria bacterium]